MKVRYTIKRLRSRDELVQLIAEEGTFVRVAERIGCSRQTVAKAARVYGVRKRGYVVRDLRVKERLRL